MPDVAAHLRPAWAEVDLRAVRANVAELCRLAAPSALCAVVKADGYGHGAVPVARAALEGGATWLAVALAEEGAVLRAAGIDAPILLLSEPPLSAWFDVVRNGLTPTVYTRDSVDALAEVARTAGERLSVHLKVDTGMHRVGAAPDEAVELARAVAGAEMLELEGVWTHFAVADEVSRTFTAVQVDRFDAFRERLAAIGIRPHLVHAANSAGLIGHGARYDLVRAGLSVYGYDPCMPPSGVSLHPALSLKARVTFVKRVPAGDAISYGLRYTFDRDSVVATVPLGYADGVPRALGLTGGEVLVSGRRRPIAGVVTMDQVTVDCGESCDVERGDEVVFLGRQGDEEITAAEWADRVGTIPYEILCGIGARVPRVYVP